MAYTPSQVAIRLGEQSWVDAILMVRFLDELMTTDRYNVNKEQLLQSYTSINKKAPFDVSTRFSASVPAKRFVFLQSNFMLDTIGRIASYLTARDRQSELLAVRGTVDHSDDNVRGKTDAYLSAMKMAASAISVINHQNANAAAMKGVFDQNTFESTFGLSWTGSSALEDMGGTNDVPPVAAPVAPASEAEVVPSVVMQRTRKLESDMAALTAAIHDIRAALKPTTTTATTVTDTSAGVSK